MGKAFGFSAFQCLPCLCFLFFPVFFLVWVGNNCKICGVSAHWQPRSCSTANASKRLNLIKPRQTIRSKKRHGLAVVICRVRQLAMAKSKDDGPGRRPLNRKKGNKEPMMPCYGRSFCNLLFWASFATATGWRAGEAAEGKKKRQERSEWCFGFVIASVFWKQLLQSLLLIMWCRMKLLVTSPAKPRRTAGRAMMFWMCYCTAGVAVFIGAYVAEEPTVAAKPDEDGEDCWDSLFRCMCLLVVECGLAGVVHWLGSPLWRRRLRFVWWICLCVIVVVVFQYVPGLRADLLPAALPRLWQEGTLHQSH